MGKSIISLLIAAAWTCGAGTWEARADEIKIAENAPDRYVVVKGDTLWGISGKFLKDPWRWPDVWGLNKDEIKNPHWIYPGDVVVLDFTGKTPRLRKDGSAADGSDVSGHDADWQLSNTKLSPTIRRQSLGVGAVSSIPMSAIRPFIGRPLVLSEEEVKAAPTVIAGQESRVVLSAGDTAFVKGVSQDENNSWNLVRPGRVLTDPDSNEVLGREVVYLGDAQVTEFGDISTIIVTGFRQEVEPGDRLARTPPMEAVAFVPHAPSAKIKGRVIAGPDDSFSEIAARQVVILNRGSREGMEIGHILALYRDRPSVKPANAVDPKERVKLPAERYGVVFVFRVFDKVSYGLVMNATRPVNVFDVVQNP